MIGNKRMSNRYIQLAPHLTYKIGDVRPKDWDPSLFEDSQGLSVPILDSEDVGSQTNRESIKLGTKEQSQSKIYQVPERLKRLRQVSGPMSKILIHSIMGSKPQHGYATLVVPEINHFVAIADSDWYGNALYCARTTDIPALFGGTRGFALSQGAKRVIHGSERNSLHTDNIVLDWMTDPKVSIIDIDRDSVPHAKQIVHANPDGTPIELIDN